MHLNQDNCHCKMFKFNYIIIMSAVYMLLGKHTVNSLAIVVYSTVFFFVVVFCPHHCIYVIVGYRHVYA